MKVKDQNDKKDEHVKPEHKSRKPSKIDNVVSDKIGGIIKSYNTADQSRQKSMVIKQKNNNKSNFYDKIGNSVDFNPLNLSTFDKRQHDGLNVKNYMVSAQRP